MTANPSRREFLALGLAVPATGLASSTDPARWSLPPVSQPLPASPVKLAYQTLGKTGLEVTTVGFGCMTTSHASVVERAADIGINYFDTARVYQQGNNERMVGAALKGRRKDILLSTKSISRDKQGALADLDTSLRELGTDYVDIWYLPQEHAGGRHGRPARGPADREAAGQDQLTITDFNTARFFGYDGSMPGGYGLYQPVHYSVNPTYNSSPENDERYVKAQSMVQHGSLVGRKIVELGCAWGSLVRYLRQLGADAYGVDLSYPISQGIAMWTELEPYLIVADARVWVPAQAKNSWDAIISRGFLDCLTDAELATFIPAMNNAAKFKQVHVIDQTDDPEFYNAKTLAQWQALPFEAGTLILDE